jgi:hypothetical protein
MCIKGRKKLLLVGIVAAVATFIVATIDGAKSINNVKFKILWRKVVDCGENCVLL